MRSEGKSGVENLSRINVIQDMQFEEYIIFMQFMTCYTYLLNDLLIYLTIMHGSFFFQISDKPFYYEWLI